MVYKYFIVPTFQQIKIIRFWITIDHIQCIDMHDDKYVTLVLNYNWKLTIEQTKK